MKSLLQTASQIMQRTLLPTCRQQCGVADIEAACFPQFCKYMVPARLSASLPHCIHVQRFVEGNARLYTGLRVFSPLGPNCSTMTQRLHDTTTRTGAGNKDCKRKTRFLATVPEFAGSSHIIRRPFSQHSPAILRTVQSLFCPSMTILPWHNTQGRFDASFKKGQTM